jgi:predicted PurR-regulated permease PerM
LTALLQGALAGAGYWAAGVQTPILLGVVTAVLGGIAAFGLVGLFLGPIVIAVLLAVWREWLIEHAAPKPVPPSPSA